MPISLLVFYSCREFFLFDEWIEVVFESSLSLFFVADCCLVADVIASCVSLRLDIVMLG